MRAVFDLGRTCLIIAMTWTLAFSSLSARGQRPSLENRSGDDRPVDLVIENARIWSDGLAGFASVLAVRDGRFTYVGEDPGKIVVGPRTERIDVNGRVVIPGLIDSHIHMLGGGLGLAELQLREVADRREFVDQIARRARELPDGRWVLGGRWSVESWADPEQPTKEWIDPLTPDNPVYLPRMDGHSALVNSVALEMAGITREGPPNPEGGVIDRDPVTNEPTGMLRESAMGLVSRFVPSPDVEQQVQALRAAAAEALRHGITTVSDIPAMSNLRAYERLATSAEGPGVRFFLYPTAGSWEDAARVIMSFEGREGWVEVRGFKAYLDGSLGSRTAMMRAPFLGNEPNRSNWRGLFREGVEDGRLERNMRAARDAKMQTIAHAIGDEANHLLLNLVESIYPETRKARCRSEHTQHLLPGDIQRFGDLGVIASMQPFHKADDGRYAESYIGADRSESSYAYRSLLDAGAIVAFGSDWPVVTLNPMLGVDAAVTGRTLNGKIWQAQETISINEALRCYTSRGAYSVFMEDELGRVAPGYRADFVVLNRSPFEENANFASIRPLAVYLDGEQAFAAD